MRGAPRQRRQCIEQYMVSQESLMFLAKRYNINHQTVAKQRNQTLFEDLPTGSKQARSTFLC